MNKKISLGITISLVAVAAAITFIITMAFSQDIFNAKVTGVKEREEIYEKLEQLDVTVRTNFNGTIDEEALQDAIAKGYVQGLNDPYAAYYSAKEYANESLNTQGQTVGIGVTIEKQESGYIKVLRVDTASPAEEAGILAGDVIVKVDGEDVLVLGYDTAVSNVRGDEGTKVTITVQRDGQEQSFELIRKKMGIISVTGQTIGDIGYIRITTFNSTTAAQFKKAVDEQTVAGVKGFVFDVRGNGGGLVSSVVEMLDYLLPEGTLATVTYKNGTTKILGTSDEEHQINLPMAVLVDHGTASASELFSAAIHDFERGKLVGVTTYGKGVMQNTYTLDDGSAVKVTVGYYYPPKSPNYDGIGIKPDYEVELNEPFETVTQEMDTQLQKALEVVATSIK